MTLSVLTLNLWNDSGPWPERAKLIREWLDRLDPDLVGLQEVLRGGAIDQCAELFEGRGYYTDYVRATDFWDDRESGFTARAITRNPDSDKAKALAELGAEVVAADLDDQASLEAAFAGRTAPSV